jgi:hypothetical protein
MKNLNADFLLDLWADLKAKRLAPVAIGLVVVMIAMPALLLKGEKAPGEGPLPIAPTSSADGAEVEVSEELAAGGSKLESYKARDPFDGLVKPTDEAAGASGTAIAPGDASGAPADKPSSSLPSLGSGGGSSPSGGSDGSGGSGGSGGGLTTPGGGGDPPQVVKNKRYTYEIDVKFGRPGREQRYPHLARMSFLPSAKLPALLFMGVPVDAKSALFFVHPTLSHQGEGDCYPSNRNCNFLELAIGRDHFLAVDDHEFRIRLLDVNRVGLKAARSQRETSGTRRSGRGVGGPAALRQGESAMPWLVDGIG